MGQLSSMSKKPMLSYIWGSADFLYKCPHAKYFRLRGPYGILSLLPYLVKVVTDYTWTSAWGCVPKTNSGPDLVNKATVRQPLLDIYSSQATEEPLSRPSQSHYRILFLCSWIWQRWPKKKQSNFNYQALVRIYSSRRHFKHEGLISLLLVQAHFKDLLLYYHYSHVTAVMKKT